MTLDPITTLIEARRVKLGIPKAELARRAGMTQPKVAAWLNGRSTITLPTLARVLPVLGLKIKESK